MLLGLRKCVFHIQMRQFLTLRIPSISQMTKKTMYCDQNWKHLNRTNTNLILSRCISQPRSNMFRLPPLMWQNPHYVRLAIFDMLFMYYYIRVTLDREFRLKAFIDGTKQAMLVISNALSEQDYETLESLVHERTMKILKSRINNLRPDQRKLIYLEKDKFMCVPGSITLRRKDDMKVVEVVMLGLYYRGEIVKFRPSEEIGIANYIFQRTYVNTGSWTGGPWTVKSITHFV